MAKTTKTTNSTTAKKESAPKKGPVSAKSTDAPKKAAPVKKAAPAKKAAPKKATAKSDPALKLEKACKDAAAKFQSLDGEKYKEIQEKLEWCIGSYNYDKNPEGLVQYGSQASNLLKEARKENPKKVSKKLVDDLDKALAGF
jgi:hypothetical protein